MKSEVYTVEFHDAEAIDTIEGKEMQAVMVHGTIINTETGNELDFDFVPLTGEVAFCEEWEEEYDEFWDQIELIRHEALMRNVRAFYLSKDGTPYMVTETVSGYGVKYWTCFNEVDGYETVFDTSEAYAMIPTDYETYRCALEHHASVVFGGQ